MDILRFLPYDKYIAATTSAGTIGDPFASVSQLIQDGTVDGQVLRWDSVASKWVYTSDMIIDPVGNVGLGTLAPNYKIHMDNGDLFLATGSIGVNEAPSPVHFLRISTNDILSQTVNARLDLSYQTKTGTFQGLHIMSNTPKSGSNSLAYGLNVTLQGAATAGTHTYIAGRFKAVGATNNYAIMVQHGEGYSIFGNNTSISNSVVQVSTLQAAGNPNLLHLHTDGLLKDIVFDRYGKIGIGRTTQIYEAITIEGSNARGRIRIDSGFNMSLFKNIGYELYTAYPNLARNIDTNDFANMKIRIALGRQSSETWALQHPEANSLQFVHYNTNRFSGITGRDYMVFYTNGLWDTTTNKPVKDTVKIASIMTAGKVGIGNVNPTHQLHVKPHTGYNALRVDTQNINNFIVTYDSGVYSRMIVGGLAITGFQAPLTVTDQLYPYTNFNIHRNATGTFGSHINFYVGSTREGVLGFLGNIGIIGANKSYFQIRNQNIGFNVPIIHFELSNGRTGIIEGNNNWGGTYSFIAETGFDIAANTKIRRQWVTGLYQNIGDKADSYTFGLESAETVDLGGGSKAVRKNEFYFQNRLGVLGVADTVLTLANKVSDNLVTTSNTDIVKIYQNGDVEILDPNAGVILTDRTDGLRKRIFINNGIINVELA